MQSIPLNPSSEWPLICLLFLEISFTNSKTSFKWSHSHTILYWFPLPGYRCVTTCSFVLLPISIPLCECPQFAYAYTCWCTFGLFLVMLWIKMLWVLCTTPFVDTHFHFFWLLTRSIIFETCVKHKFKFINTLPMCFQKWLYHFTISTVIQAFQ